MTILATDPFSTLIYQQAQIATPLVEGGAGGADDLDTAQRSITIGEVIPIVFGRRVGDIGGVLISPGATEARFENDTVNAVTATYHLVLSEGQLQPVQVRDLFQRSCRVGTFTQSYNRRGGSWTAGNFIVDRVGYTRPECPYYCGNGGTYEGMSTGSFEITAPDGDTRWDRQVHLFIRGGMYVTRLLDATFGPSNNVADLSLWLLRNTSRTPELLIDLPAFEAAASFTDQLGLWFNGQINESQNLEDWLANNARYFLLSKSKRGGKVGLRPLLPTTDTNALQITPVQPVYVFNEARIVPGSFEISYIPLNERKPFCALMLWRQQPEDDIGLIRTTEVRYEGLAVDGPFEQHDLSVFATSENHAVKVGAYIVARRRYVTHTLRIKVRPANFNATLSQGDIVQVIMQRVASSAVSGEHRYLYEVDRIGKSRSGEVELNLTHFPVDELGRSLVALDVATATGGGIMFSTTKSGISCDVNADDDTTPAIDDGLDLDPLDDDNFDAIIPDGGFGSSSNSSGGGDGGSGSPEEPGDGGGESIDGGDGLPLGFPPGGPGAGDTITAPTVCPNQRVRWLRSGEPIPDYPIGNTFEVTDGDAGTPIRGFVECDDGTYETDEAFVNPTENLSGFDRPIQVQITIRTNNGGQNSCSTGEDTAPGSTGTFTVQLFGTGAGYRIVKGSNFQSITCGLTPSDTALPGTELRVDLIAADGSVVGTYNGSADRQIVSTVNSGFISQSVQSVTVIDT